MEPASNVNGTRESQGVGREVDFGIRKEPGVPVGTQVPVSSFPEIYITVALLDLRIIWCCDLLFVLCI